jgi:hypothetical protein
LLRVCLEQPVELNVQRIAVRSDALWVPGDATRRVPMRYASARFGVLLLVMLSATAAAQAQPNKPNATTLAGRPLGPGAFFIPAGPNPFAGPTAVFDCKFFSDDIDRKIKGCSAAKPTGVDPCRICPSLLSSPSSSQSLESHCRSGRSPPRLAQS